MSWWGERTGYRVKPSAGGRSGNTESMVGNADARHRLCMRLRAVCEVVRAVRDLG
jgi:hypothetical protein